MARTGKLLWTGDSEQTPGGIDRAARNAKRSRQLLLSKKHGLRSDRNYYMPANLADAMIRLLDGSSNEGLTTLSQVLRRGQHTLGQLWTSQLSPQALEDLKAANTVLPGLNAQFEAAQPHAQRQPPTFVDAELLAGTTINFPRSPCAPCLDLAACRYPPTHGWRHTSSFKFPDRRSE